MTKLDDRLFPLLQTLATADADWLIFELIDGIGAGIVIEETPDDLDLARIFARQDREPRRPADRTAISVQSRALEGDEQIVWAARYIGERLQSALDMMDSSVERLESIINGTRLEARSDTRAGVTLRFSDNEGAGSMVSIEGRRAARAGIQDLLPALDRWAREATGGRAAL